MFEKEFQEWFERNKKWLYSSDHMQAAYHAWCAGVQQQQAAQQSVHPTNGGRCEICNTPANEHRKIITHGFKPAISG